MNAVGKIQSVSATSDTDLVGKHLRMLREQRSESLRNVADAVECSAKHLWAVENGGVQRPGNELLIRLADYFEVSLDELFGRTHVGSAKYLPETLVQNWPLLSATAREKILGLVAEIAKHS